MKRPKGVNFRSAITGMYVKFAVWRRWPKTTVSEKRKK